MTKTMKKVLTLALIGVMFVSAAVFGTTTKAFATPADVTEFTAIVQTFVGGSVTDADLTDEDVQKDLISAKSYFDNMTKAEKDSLDAVIVEEWTKIQAVAGDALSVYSSMASLSVYLREVGAPRISVKNEEARVSAAKMKYEALGENTNSKLLVDQRIAYDDPANNKSFFPDLEALLQAAWDAIANAEAKIDAVWEGIEAITLSRETLINEATAAVEAVIASDRELISNLDAYEQALEELAAIKENASELAVDVAALYVTLDTTLGAESYYSKSEEIYALKDVYDNFVNIDADLQTYFQTAYPTEYAQLMEMLAYCEAVEDEIANVIELIEAIGDVTYTDECLNKIVAAETAYDALDADVKAGNYVENYQDLVDARAKYEEIKAAVDPVVALIDAIVDPIALNQACEDSIVAAETAFEALTEEYKNNVPADKKQELEDAREAYDALLEGVNAWIERVEALLGEGQLADLWSLDLDEVADLADIYNNDFTADEKAYVDAEGATQLLSDILNKGLDNVTETDNEIAGLMNIQLTAEDPTTIEKLLEVKEMYDTLHETQQELINNKYMLDMKYSIYEFSIYFDKAVAAIKANVDAGLYFDQDYTLMNTLNAFYNVIRGSEAEALITSYQDLKACEAVLNDAELVDANDVNEKLVEMLNNKVAELQAAIEKAEADAASSNTVSLVIAIVAAVIAIAGVVLFFVKRK